MNKKNLKNIIAKGENLTTEFKQRFSTHTKIAKEIIAFANTKGGLLIFGIDDDGSIYGVESEKEIAELLKETTEEYCEPKIDYKLNFHYHPKVFRKDAYSLIIVYNQTIY